MCAVVAHVPACRTVIRTRMRIRGSNPCTPANLYELGYLATRWGGMLIVDHINDNNRENRSPRCLDKAQQASHLHLVASRKRESYDPKSRMGHPATAVRVSRNLSAQWGKKSKEVHIMPGFTKLFSTIITSSIWSEDSDTCKVWITLLALSDAEGFVSASVPGVANAARLDNEKTRAVLKVLESPDPDSRSVAFDGRRVEKVDGGWLILNYVTYRESKGEAPVSTDPRKSQSRQLMRKLRNERKQTLTGPLTPENGIESNPLSSNVVSGALTGANPSASAYASVLPEVLNTNVFREAFGRWQEHKRQIKDKSTPLAVEMQVKKCVGFGHDAAIIAIEHSIANGYRGIFEPNRANGNGSFQRPPAEEIHEDDPRTAERYK